MSKLIPCGLLAVAVSSVLVAQDGDKPMAGGWSAKPGSGLKYDGGDAFALNWTNLVQVHWTYTGNENGPDINTFNIRRARTTLSGHAFSKDILYKLQLGWEDAGAAGDAAVKDAFVQWNFASSDDGTVGLRVGQGKTMFGLEGTGTAAGLWFVERSSAARAFADSRSRGAWINGVVFDKKMRYTLGAMNTDVANGLGAGYTDRGEETNNSDNELSYVFAINFDPLGDFFGGKQTTESMRQGDWRTDDTSLKGTIGAGLALGNGRSAAPVQDVESTSLTLNTAWSVAHFNVLGEYYMRTDDQQGPVSNKEEPMGWAIAAGYLFSKSGDSPMQWGVGLRVNSVESDAGANGTVDFLSGMQGIGAAPGKATEVTAVVNAFYHGHQCKTQLEYTFQDVDPDAGTSSANSIIRIGFQLEF